MDKNVLPVSSHRYELTVKKNILLDLLYFLSFSKNFLDCLFCDQHCTKVYWLYGSLSLHSL